MSDQSALIPVPQSTTATAPSLPAVDGELLTNVEVDDLDRFAKFTTPDAYAPVAVVRPQAVSDVRSIVDTARESGIALYPVSRGKNWGYGTATPTGPNQIVVDLSSLNRISEFDADLGLVTLEPGVSQQQLSEFLRDGEYPFLVPATGAGPEASVLGNVLERGYGITPYSDHFAAVTAFEAVLPDGSLYRSALSELGGQQVDRAFKWGIGPYVDGLFTQSNLGIVTQATIALAPEPTCSMGFFFSVERDDQLEAVVDRVRTILRSVGSAVSAVNLMNQHRVLAMIEPYPSDAIGDDGLIEDDWIRRASKHHGLGAWMGAGALYGDPTVLRAVRKIIRRELGPMVKRMVFLRRQTVTRMRSLAQRMPGRFASQTARRLSTIEAALSNFAGEPSEVALPLAYWRSGTTPAPGLPIDPARDGCGLTWYSPLVPMTSSCVRQYVEMATATCQSHGMEPLITLTSISDRCFDSTVPILFDKSDPTQTEQARACYQALFDAGRSLGCLPYRVGTQSMELVVDPELAHWNLVSKIKDAIDPKGVIAPGRYCPNR